MYKPISLYIGLRYTRAKRRHHFVSVISLISILSFALAVCALIAVLSVMNGFDEQIKKRVFSMAQQVGVSTYHNFITDWPKVATRVAKNPEVESVAPYVAGQGMLTNFGQAHAALIFGILPEDEIKVSEVGSKIVAGSLEALQSGKFGIVLGQDLASNLGAMVGDRVILLTPAAAATPLGIIPRFKWFTVVGIFHMGSGFGFDSNFAYIHLGDAQKLYQMDDKVTGLRLKLTDLYRAPIVAKQIRQELPPEYLTTDWTEQYGAFFQAVALEKTSMFFILMILIVLTAFNLLSSLFMVVTDKQSDIAILRTLGATPKMILAIFMVQGTVIGIIGTILGLIGGVLLALNITDLANALQHYFQVQLLSSSVHYVDYLPSKLEWRDSVKVCGAAIAASMLATLIPAWLASRVQPADALRYE